MRILYQTCTGSVQNLYKVSTASPVLPCSVLPCPDQPCVQNRHFLSVDNFKERAHDTQ